MLYDFKYNYENKMLFTKKKKIKLSIFLLLS